MRLHQNKGLPSSIKYQYWQQKEERTGIELHNKAVRDSNQESTLQQERLQRPAVTFKSPVQQYPLDLKNMRVFRYLVSLPVVRLRGCVGSLVI